MFKSKPSVAMIAFPAFTGGVRAQAQINETLISMLAHMVATPQVVIVAAKQKIVENRLVDEDALGFALNAMNAVLREIALRKHFPAAA